jgi:hypothetical protein
MATETRILLTALLIFTHTLIAQTEFKKNYAYIEFGGNGIFASINYERQLFKKPGLGLRLGCGIIPLVGASFPAGVNYIVKTKRDNSLFEMGFGITYILGKTVEKTERITYVPSIAYRHHSKRNRIIRVAFTPIFNDSSVYPVFGISFGKIF